MDVGCVLPDFAMGYLSTPSAPEAHISYEYSSNRSTQYITSSHCLLAINIKNWLWMISSKQSNLKSRGIRTALLLRYVMLAHHWI